MPTWAIPSTIVKYYTKLLEGLMRRFVGNEPVKGEQACQNHSLKDWLQLLESDYRRLQPEKSAEGK